MGTALLRTPFYDFHLSSGARMVDFAGWEMPLMYRSIVEEHEQTRRSGSIFDVSHMGRLHITGRDAQAFLDKALTRKISDQAVGQCRYSLVCDQSGGVLDDVIVSRDSQHYLVVCNASNRPKIVQHFLALRRSLGMDFDLADQTQSTAMMAVQGPKVIERLGQALSTDLNSIKRYHFTTLSMMGLVKLTVFRSGYTGEDGVEIIFAAKVAPMAISMLNGRGDKPNATLKAAGLGARDTLRLEAGMPLYGHELTQETDPLSAGLSWAVDLTKDFVGAEVLRALKQKGLSRKLVGLELEGQRIARQAAPVQAGSDVVGVVTSGTLSPTLGKSIAMAYVDLAHGAAGSALSVDLKGTPVAAKVVKLPFYQRK